MNAMPLVRLGIVAAMGGALALWAGHLFDRAVPDLLVAALVPVAAAAAVHRRRWFVRLPVAVAAVVASVVAVAFATGGGLPDARDGFASGLRRVLSTEWPSPVRPDLTATVGLLVGTVTAAAAELAGRRRLRLAPVGPITIGAVAVIALSAPRGPSAHWPVVVGALAAMLAALGPDDAAVDGGDGATVRDRLRVLRGERRLLATATAVVVVTAGAAAPLTMGDRADPRDTRPADRSATLLDPIEATLALQQIDPPVELHRIELEGRGPEVPARWRTAALAEYDGRRWRPELTLRPIGRRLSADPGPEVAVAEADITFLDDDLQLVPLPGLPVVVEADIESDETRTLVRLVERPDDDDTVRVVARVEPTGADLLTEPLGRRAIDDSVSGLSDLADELAGDGGQSGTVRVIDQLEAMERTLRDEFVLDPAASGGGLQRALIERFLRDTRRGTAEQFATAFVLLARSKGADARVATGYVVADTDVQGEVITLSSADAAIWPEVRSGGEWLAFDPVPTTPFAGETPPAEPSVQSPAAPQPPIAPPPDDLEEPVDVGETGDEAVEGTVPALVELMLRGAAWLGVVLVPALLLVVGVIGAKWRRRRARLRGAPAQRIRGAWQEATDQLVDAGLAIDVAMTNDEIARAGAPLAPTAGRELDRLATLSTAVTFGEPARPDLLVADAVTCLAAVGRSVDGGHPLRSRVRRRLSLRSLRVRTRTPV